MFYIMEDLYNLKNDNISIDSLDEMVNTLYCSCFKPIGVIEDGHRVYRYKDMFLYFKCLFVKKDDVIKENIVKILEIKAI